MVSNTLNMKHQEVVEALKRLRREFKDSSDYKEWRGQLPKDWPI